MNIIKEKPSKNASFSNFHSIAEDEKKFNPSTQDQGKEARKKRAPRPLTKQSLYQNNTRPVTYTPYWSL